jgi:hypothetical protein
MKYPIRYKAITANTEFYTEVVQAYEEATEYLAGFTWCKKIINSDIYLNLGSTLCIFLFRIENIASRENDHLWIIVGDIPPMYLDVFGPKTTKQVLEDYIRLAEDWIEHVKLGNSVDNCYPFIAKPTLEMATMLEKRTSFMKNTLINEVDDIPISFM